MHRSWLCIVTRLDPEISENEMELQSARTLVRRSADVGGQKHRPKGGSAQKLQSPRKVWETELHPRPVEKVTTAPLATATNAMAVKVEKSCTAE